MASRLHENITNEISLHENPLEIIIRLGEGGVNVNKPFVIKVVTGSEYDHTLDTFVNKFRLVHFTSAGTVWKVEAEETELVFESTLHT